MDYEIRSELNLTFKEWVRLMGRSTTEFTIDYVKTYTYVCEDHFDKDVKLDYRKVSSLIILN